MIETRHKQRTWGFRFSVTDGAALVLFTVAAFGLHRLMSPLWWLLLIAAGHFFLFCNVFRIRRSLELWWAGLLLANCGAWLLFERLDWLTVIPCQLPVTAAVLLAEIRSARYHGIFARWLNRKLDDYLNGNIA
jgi:hypothetical protein